MKIPGSGLRIDSPAWPLLQASLTYWGITDAAGSALGVSLVCGDLANWPSYEGLAVKILDGGAAGQVKPIAAHVAGTGTLTVADAFRDNTGAIVQIVAGTRFVILSTTGGGGAPPPPLTPSIGLWMFGECAPGMAASVNTLVMPNLAGFPDDIFNGEFWIQVIHNASAPGTAPEREIRHIDTVGGYVGATGTFVTDDFSADVEAGDLVCVFHESIMSLEILGYGTLDTSSATVPADSTRTGLYAWEVNNYFRGCLFMATEGAARFSPKRIVQYTNATGVFTIDPNNPLPAAPGLVDYIIIGDQTEFIPGVDGVNNRTPSDVTGGKADTAIHIMDNVSSIIRYLKGLLMGVRHVDKFSGEQWFVSKLGNDGNSGMAPDDAFLTILFGVAAAAAGDRITVMAGTYDEADLNLNLEGLELICEQGTIINHTVTPGTVLIVSASYCRVVGPILVEVGQTGMQITGDFCSIENCLAFGCDTGFDDNGLETHMIDCRSVQHTTTGFAIAGSYGEHERLIAVGAGAVRGIYLDVNTADYNHFKNCHTLGNTTAGWEVVAGADNNVFSNCTTGGGDGAKVDAGANNTWANWGEGSQIVAGQSRDQDLKDIFDLIGAGTGFQEQADVAVNITAVNGSETDVLDLSVAATRYIVRNLRLKCVDPGANTVTVRLYELVNDGAVEVGSWEITTANFGTYFSLMDMFGVPYLAGDDLQVTVRASAGGPYAVTGQYSHATA